VILLAVVCLGGVALAAQFTLLQTPFHSGKLGRLYGSLLHLPVSVDLLVAFSPCCWLLWPKGAAVALAAFREGVRQPCSGTSSLPRSSSSSSPVHPVFHVRRRLPHAEGAGLRRGHAGRRAGSGCWPQACRSARRSRAATAITLMSKPVSRRQFLLGKFVRILLAASVMTGCRLVFRLGPHLQALVGAWSRWRVPRTLDHAAILLGAGESTSFCRG